MADDTLRRTLRATKALADNRRLRILMMLQAGELCVCQITETLGLAPSTVSKHLSLLAAADLVECRKDGRWAYYRLSRGANAALVKPVLAWLRQALQDDPAIGRDRKKLAAIVACDPESLCERQRNRR